MPAYQHALLSHIKEYAPQLDGYLTDSVYFGGGTPSYYGSDRLISIFNALKKYGHILLDAEVTAEVNPDSITKADLVRMRRAGFNRLSIGVQSANDALLKVLAEGMILLRPKRPSETPGKPASEISISISYTACPPRAGTIGPTH